MPSLFDRFLQRRGYQRSALIPSIDDVMQMSGWYAATANMLPTQTINHKAEAIGSGFRELAAGAYASNPIVFACMLARVQLFSQARFQFQKMQNGVPGELFNNPATYLRLLETPWPGGTTAQLLSEMLTDADLGGNAFVARRDGQLQRLRPDWTVIIAGNPNTDATAWDVGSQVLGYGYQPDGPAGNKDWIYFQPSEVAHFKPVSDPLRRFAGMSWLVPIIREIMGDQAATAHKLAYFEHGATPNMIIKFDQVMTKAQADDWVRLFNEKHEGSRNAYRTLFLGGGSDATVVGANLQQVDFAKVQAGGELRIASAGGVPPIIIGISGGLEAATYSNYGQARRAFADLTIRPLWNGVCGALTAITQVPDNARLWYDERNISFLQEDIKDAADIQQVQANAIRTLLDAGFTAASVTDSVIAADFSRLKHSGLFSVQLQAPGSSKMPAGEVPGEVPVGPGTKPEDIPAGQPTTKAPAKAAPMMNSARLTAGAEMPTAVTSASPVSGEVRCSSCDRLLAEIATAPYRFSCQRCKNVTSSGLTLEPSAA